MLSPAKKKQIFTDLALVLASALFAVTLVATGAVEHIMAIAPTHNWLTSLIAGFFFVSIFTAAPAGVVLAELGQVASPLTVAIWGGAGSVLGDLLVFRFIRNHLLVDLAVWLRSFFPQWLKEARQVRVFRWFLFLLGAILIASPLPDELGLGLMGISRVKTTRFVPLFFVLNAFGILSLIELVHFFAQ